MAEFSANVIAESMLSQCDLDGNQYLLLDSIVDYRSDGHVVKANDMYVTVNGRKHAKKTTQGWHLCVQWKDGSTSWERLADLKCSNPVEVAEYAVAQGIAHEPAFAWWVPHTIRKRNFIVAAVTKRYHKRTHKFGIHVPKTIEEARQLDKENGNTLWEDAIRKEMDAVRVSFKIIQDEDSILPGYQHIQCHLVFDVKMEKFR